MSRAPLRFWLIPLSVAAACAVPLLSAAPAAAAPPRCDSGDLTVTLGRVSPGAGQRFARLRLRNHSGHTCRIRGYVGLQLADRQRRALPTTPVRTGRRARGVTLKPDARAFTRLHWGVIPGAGEPVNGPCERTPSDLLVTPPGEAAHIAVRWTQGPVCQHGRFVVGPVRKD